MEHHVECEMPTVNADDEEVKKLFEQTETIAVIGASPNPQKDSHRVAKYLLEAGFEMIPVYPKEDEILGQKVYRSLKEIDKEVDMVVVFRKSEAVPFIADACLERGDVKTLWLQIGIVHNEAAQKCKDAGIAVVQNKCAMIEHKKLFG